MSEENEDCDDVDWGAIMDEARAMLEKPYSFPEFTMVYARRVWTPGELYGQLIVDARRIQLLQAWGPGGAGMP